MMNLGPYHRSPARQVCLTPTILTGIERAYFPADKSSAVRCLMTAYLKLSDAEWEAIRPYLPPQRSGPRRKHDRETVTAFLFAQAAGVSLHSLPDCGFPNALSLRTTWQRWRASGELAAVMAAGSPAAARMARQYRQRITDLSLRRRPPKAIGRRSATMPRWVHMKGA